MPKLLSLSHNSMVNKWIINLLIYHWLFGNRTKPLIMLPTEPEHIIMYQILIIILGKLLQRIPANFQKCFDCASLSVGHASYNLMSHFYSSLYSPAHTSRSSKSAGYTQLPGRAQNLSQSLVGCAPWPSGLLAMSIERPSSVNIIK